ncbi:MAG: hypothetical protein V4550_18415 [Gemmatimonadota bacterium]
MIGVEMPTLRVKSVNTAVFAASMMAADNSAGNVGDEDPAFTLQPGANVWPQGKSVPNTKGVQYTPVTVNGHDGLYFIRTSSLAPLASIAKVNATVGWWFQPAWSGAPVKRWQAAAGAGAAITLSSLLITFLRRK